MDRLVDTVATALAIRNTAQTGTGQQTQGARNDTSLVANDITEQVAGNNNTVQLTGILDHQHSSRVNEVVTEGNLRVLLLHHLVNNLTPETASREDISLIQAPNGERRVVLQSEVGSEANNTLDLGPRVGLSVHGVSGAVVFLALAEVDTTSQLTDDVEVDTAADVGLEGGALDQRGRGEVAWAQVSECAHLLAQLQDALLGANGACAPFLYAREYGGFMVVCGGFRRTGPPMAPRRTASAFLAASRASSVRGEPVASMEAWCC